MDLRKAPSISETVDFARAMMLLGKSALRSRDGAGRGTLGLLVKHEEDRAKVEAVLPTPLRQA
ncbi:MAG: hypothetical protein U0235_26555 [Polyangiaceae bacterium]